MILALFSHLSLFYSDKHLSKFSDMPVAPEVPADGHRVGEVHAEHPLGRPAVHQVGVGGIASVRHPDGREVGAPVIG